MTAKEFLSRAMTVNREIDSKLSLVATLRETMTKATAVLSDMPRSGSPNLQTVESTVAKIVDLESEINCEIDRLVDLLAEAQKAISAVEKFQYRYLLELRYLHFKSWTQIMEIMNLSETSVYRIHLEALKKVHIPEKWE